MTTVTPELSDFLIKVNEIIQAGIQHGVELTPDIARDNLAKLAYFSSAPEDIAAINNNKLSLSDREVPVRIYQPILNKPLPILIYFHGGGHMCGSIEVYDNIARRIANKTLHTVISVDYRLAPEYPYPCGLEDCLAVVDNMLDLLANIPFQTDQLSLAGDSAGGALAVSVANQTQKKIKNLILIYPSLDYTFSTDSYTRLAQGYLLETSRIQWYFDHYFDRKADRKKASPLFFANLKALPPCLIIAAGLDPLVDEGKIFHDTLSILGVPSEYHLEPDLIHAFMNLDALIPNHMPRIYDQISNFLSQPAPD